MWRNCAEQSSCSMKPRRSVGAATQSPNWQSRFATDSEETDFSVACSVRKGDLAASSLKTGDLFFAQDLWRACEWAWTNDSSSASPPFRNFAIRSVKWV